MRKTFMISFTLIMNQTSIFYYRSIASPDFMFRFLLLRVFGLHQFVVDLFPHEVLGFHIHFFSGCLVTDLNLKPNENRDCLKFQRITRTITKHWTYLHYKLDFPGYCKYMDEETQPLLSIRWGLFRTMTQTSTLW